MVAIAAIVLLAAQIVQRHEDAVQERHFSERVNLALRQTAHRLLVLAGDRNSRIPPVEQLEENTWLIRLEHNFDYDSLPPVLQESFAWHGVAGDYQVAVLDCGSDILMLGYTASLFTGGKEVPCGGREQTAGCYNLKITFPDRAAAAVGEKRYGYLLTFACLALLVLPAFSFFIYLKKKRSVEKTSPTSAVHIPEKDFAQQTVTEKNAIRIGHSTLHVANQKLVFNGTEKDLTYRETKLLQLFCSHPNQLLERDLILKAVWEDEGIIVGRSVDVFVSRLRKLLKDDESVQIANVHGVGYRLEVKGEIERKYADKIN